MNYQPHRLEFILYGEPVPKGRPRVAVRGKVPTIYTPKITVAYEKTIRALGETARQQYTERTGEFWPMHAAAYYVFLNIFVSKNNADGDNVFKSVADGLIGSLYADDRKVGGYFPPPAIGAPRVEAVVLAFEAMPEFGRTLAAVQSEVVVALAKRLLQARADDSRELALSELVNFVRSVEP